MGYYTKDLSVFTFASSVSNILSGMDDCEGVTIYANTSSGVFTVQIAESTGGTFVDLQSAAVDVTVTAPNAVVISPVPFRQMRLASTYGSTGGAGPTSSTGAGFPVQAVFVV